MIKSQAAGDSILREKDWPNLSRYEGFLPYYIEHNIHEYIEIWALEQDSRSKTVSQSFG